MDGGAASKSILRNSKRHVLSTILSTEFTVLTRLLTRIAAGHYSTRDYTAGRLRDALELFVLNFPIYRTYVTAAGASPADRAIIETTIERCRIEWIGFDVSVLDFLQGRADVRSRSHRDGQSTASPACAVSRSRSSNLPGPMMAKSLEDTAFYRHHRLLALNEVATW